MPEREGPAVSEEPPSDREPTDESAGSSDGYQDDEHSAFAELAASTDETDADLFETAFREANPEALDSEELWDELDSFESAWPKEKAADVTVVGKRNFCQRCPHLSDPPTFQCTHEGTEILEFVDSDHVTVRNCPVVARRRGLE